MRLNDPTLFRQQAMINGRWRDASGKETLAVTNPANGQPLGKHEGYFQRFSLDASAALQRHNQLVVRVDSPYEDPHKVWPLHKTVMKGILNQHDTRPGGAWSPEGQDANSGGIWAPVRLHLSRGAT
ncbi:MAG: hypothetical protein E7J78_19780, partial [Pantoea sp.]|nr:hypothetical protein [Pantoea sp.]